MSRRLMCVGGGGTSGKVVVGHGVGVGTYYRWLEVSFFGDGAGRANFSKSATLHMVAKYSLYKEQRVRHRLI
eukprot:scaffold23396_cov20-Cyclotella_meneghiniana.AAC.1